MQGFASSSSFNRVDTFSPMYPSWRLKPFPVPGRQRQGEPARRGCEAARSHPALYSSLLKFPRLMLVVASSLLQYSLLYL